jgi:CHASE2 domain-containing sensor protein
VIIGASAPDFRDLHLTPLGDMPGAMIVANQLRSLLERDGPMQSSTDLWGGLIITVFCTVTTFVIWLTLRHWRPTMPCFLQNVALGGTLAIWTFALAFSSSPTTAWIIPLTQWLVMLGLMAIKLQTPIREKPA